MTSQLGLRHRLLLVLGTLVALGAVITAAPAAHPSVRAGVSRLTRSWACAVGSGDTRFAPGDRQLVYLATIVMADACGQHMRRAA